MFRRSPSGEDESCLPGRNSKSVDWGGVPTCAEASVGRQENEGHPLGWPIIYFYNGSHMGFLVQLLCSGSSCVTTCIPLLRHEVFYSNYIIAVGAISLGYSSYQPPILQTPVIVEYFIFGIDIEQKPCMTLKNTTLWIIPHSLIRWQRLFVL